MPARLTRCVLAELDGRDDSVLLEDSATRRANSLARRLVVLDLRAPTRRARGGHARGIQRSRKQLTWTDPSRMAAASSA